MPSSVGSRWTTTLVGGTSAILMVLFSEAKIASERSKPTFLASTSNAATNFDVAHVILAEGDVHQAGDVGCSGRRRRSTERPEPARTRSCRRRLWRRAPHSTHSDSTPCSVMGVYLSRTSFGNFWWCSVLVLFGANRWATRSAAR